jgi:magnesium chelatase family protein
MIPSPGVITLADRGVLFLDEFPEFGRENLNLLRQPMEDHEIRISRTSGTFVYPARCLVLAAMNPCPCGYFPDPQKCRCTAPEIERYLSHVSGPILDRIDLCAETPRVGVTSLMDGKKEECSADIRSRVMDARERQIRRFAGTGMRFNGDMDARAVGKYCGLGKEEADFMKTAFEKLQLSARAYHRTLKTARTIADLRGGERISADDLAEALGYRVSDRKYWNNGRTRT